MFLRISTDFSDTNTAPEEKTVRQLSSTASPAHEGEPPRRMRGLNPKRVRPGWFSAQRGGEFVSRKLLARGQGRARHITL